MTYIVSGCFPVQLPISFNKRYFDTVENMKVRHQMLRILLMEVLMEVPVVALD